MAGGTLRHSAIKQNLSVAVGLALRLFEVLSEGTEAWDRGEKFRPYRQLPSLQHDVLVSTSDPVVEVYTRGPDDGWVLRPALFQDQPCQAVGRQL